MNLLIFCILVVWSILGTAIFIKKFNDEWTLKQMVIAVLHAGPIIIAMALIIALLDRICFVYSKLWQWAGK